MKDLAHFARIYQPWGLMSLWNIYLERGDEWTIKMGYSIPNFIRQLPRLVDLNWKGMAATYERQMVKPVPKELSQLQLFGKHKKRVGNTTRIEYIIDRERLKNH